MPPHESGEWIDGTPREREMLVAKTDFSMEVVRFTDIRRPRSMNIAPKEQFIDVYDPENVLQGISTRMPMLYEKYLAYKPKQLKHYKVEFDLLDLRTEILNGNFWSGRFGRYAIALELEATVRRPDSSVVLRRVYKVQDEQPRRSGDGYSPSQKMDEVRLMALVDAAVRKTSMDLAWDVRQLDARRWKPEREKPVPTASRGLKAQPSINRAIGAVGGGYGSDLVAPEESYAPDSVPLTIIEMPSAE